MIRAFLIILIFSVGKLFAQPENDLCSNATLLCPNSTISANNIGATASICNGCEDDFGGCFTSNNSVWFYFYTNDVGGNVDVNVSGLSFNIQPNQSVELDAYVVSSSIPCNGQGYTLVSNCATDQIANFTLSCIGLAPLTKYYVQINGSINGVGVTEPAEANFDIEVTGNGVIRPTPSISLATDSLNVCQNQLVNLVASVSNCVGDELIQWYKNGTLIAQSPDFLYQTNSLIGNDTIQISINCDTVCQNEVFSNQIIFDVIPISAYAGAQIEIEPGEEVQLHGVGVGTPHWEPQNIVSDPDIFEPYTSPNITTTYFLTVENDVCSAYDSVTVKVKSALEIPQAFTPNGDNTNDKFEIVNIQLYPDCELIIYDRWGQKVYQTVGYFEDKWWDGTKGGKNLPEGTYYYYLELNDEEDQIIKGYIALIR